MERPPVLMKKEPAMKTMIGTFIHTYRWGRQIRGDERGYIEKVKRYRTMGIEFFTIELKPSIQDGMKEHVYTSLTVRNCRVPPPDIGHLLVLTLCSLGAAMRRYPSRPVGIYAYNQDIENLWIAYLLKVLLGSPLIVVYHQVRPAAFTAFGSGVADRIHRGFNPVRAVLRSLLPAINRFAARRADVNIALSEATREDVERFLGIKNCSVVGNGLDTVNFHPIDSPKTFDAAFLGRLAPQKGIDVLLKAWSLVIRENPSSRLVLLGGGDSEDVLRYKMLAKDLHLDDNVTFAGFAEDADLVRVLNSSRIFVFPSRKEGFAQAVSQAMGCGLCCVLSDIPPLREVYGDAAVFVKPEQPTLLAEEIRHLLESEDERELYSKRARRLAETFSWEETVRREIAALTKLSGKRR